MLGLLSLNLKLNQFLDSNNLLFLRDILKEIEAVIQDFGKSQGYSFIFNDKVLVYKSEGSDPTAQVIKALNDTYTAKKK